MKDQNQVAQNQDLMVYAKTLENNAVSLKNEIIHNYGSAHAKFVCSTMFRHAKESVKIWANNLCNKEVSCDFEYISSMDSFLDNDNAQLQIFLTNFSEEDFYKNPKFFLSLYLHDAYSEGRIKIKYLVQKTNKPLVIWNDSQGRSGEAHFCVADHIMTRVETDTKTRSAICNFGDKDRATELESVFDKIFSSAIATELSLEQLVSVPSDLSN